MKKFRERIERERAEKKLKEVHKLKEDTDVIETLARQSEEVKANGNNSKESSDVTESAPSAKPAYKPPPGLALVDTDEEDNNGDEGEEGGAKKNQEDSKMEEDDDGVDPLDAYMEGIVKEVSGI